MAGGRHERVCDRVWRVGGGALSGAADCLVYAVDLGALVLVDCGCGPGWERLRANLASAGLDPDRLDTLVLTHCHLDHIGAAAQIVRDTRCRVVAHRLDAGAIEAGCPVRTAADWYGLEVEPVPVDIPVVGPECRLDFPDGTLTLVHTPGHTPGSLVAWLDTADGRVVFGQDVHGPFDAAFGSDIAAWRESMARLLALAPDILCEGHSGIYRSAAAARRYVEEQLAAHPAGLDGAPHA
jgi:glyoxylase-like metal-dependent hydrolase (beta-lactamase superfamily II)